MPNPTVSRFRQRQQGAITIIVVLMLLVLLMVAAFGMSRDALRELGITGTSRQGAEVFNEADTGINWSVYWMFSGNQALSGSTQGGKDMTALMAHLQDPSLLGQTKDATYPGGFVVNPSGEMITTSGAKTSQFSINLTQMGRMYPNGTSQNLNMVAIAPLVWNLRSNGSVAYTGAATFTHDREAWVTTPVSRSIN